MSTTYGGLTEDDQKALDALERAQSRPAGDGGELSASSVIQFDGSDVDLKGGDNKRSGVWEEGWHAVLCVEALPKKSGKGNRYVEMDWRSINPDDDDENPLIDRLMLDGNGRVRFVLCAQVCGLWDSDRKALLPGTTFESFVGKTCWVEVKNNEESWVGDDGEERTSVKAVVTFRGFAAIGSRPMPWVRSKEMTVEATANDPFTDQ